MNILGINCYLHESSVALFRDGEMVFAAEEERFSRVKKDARFPRLALQAALDFAGIEFGDLDAIAFGWNRPAVTPLHTFRAGLTRKLAPSPKMTVDSLMQMARELYYGNGKRALTRAFPLRNGQPLLYIDHHEAHAWSTYALSGFEDALVVVVDGRGSRQATSLYHARNGRLEVVTVIEWPNSLGSFYEAFTDLLGFERHSDEWKVMGLAAYGEPRFDLSSVLQVGEGTYQLDSQLVLGRWWNDITPLEARFGPRRHPEKEIRDEDRDLAASVQQTAEAALFSVVREGVRLTGCRNVCLAGGVAMNSKANGRLLASGIADDVFVQPAATDDGTAVGAALAAHAAIGAPVPRYRLRHVYLGPQFGNDEIETVLRTYKLAGTRVPDVERTTAQLVADGAIVGWFQGRLEFGPRALGSRSILADPRLVEMRDRVNEVVKFREGWRPFAPSCLEEAAGDYFEGAKDAAFMTLCFDVKPSRRSEIPAVTHADNTSRIQTVNKDASPRYWSLISEFGKLTGTPVIMNTSFNLKGEPIVCTPKDAIRTFYSSGLDYLVLGDFVVAKDPAWTAKAEAGQATASNGKVKGRGGVRAGSKRGDGQS